MEATEQALDNDFLAAVAGIPDTLGSAPAAAGNVSVAAPAEPSPTALPLTVELLEQLLSEASGLPEKFAGKERAFWQLNALEAKGLAELYHPYVKPLWDRVGAEKWGKIAQLVLPTLVVIGPRIAKEKALRDAATKRPESTTGAMATETSTASPSSQAPPEVESLLKPIDWPETSAAV